MPLDTVKANPGLQPELRDDIEHIKQHVRKPYISPWTRLEKSATISLTHGLGDFPFAVDVLQATDAQGTGAATASDVTITRTATVVTVAETGGTNSTFIRVRAL